MEAGRAGCAAGAPLEGEDEQRLRVRVPEVSVVPAARVGVEPFAQPVDDEAQPVPVPVPQRLLDGGEVGGGEHVAVGHDEPVEGVVGGARPVDEFVGDVGGDPEGQHPADDLGVVAEGGLTGAVGDESAEAMTGEDVHRCPAVGTSVVCTVVASRVAVRSAPSG